MSKPTVLEYKPELDLSCTNPDRNFLLKDAREFIKTLSPRRARIGHLYYTEGLTIEAVSEVENITMIAVKKNLEAIGKILRERYGT